MRSTLGTAWCPPELREAPFAADPPPLVDIEDIRGDLHSHTTWSDGRASAVAVATARRGGATAADVLNTRGPEQLSLRRRHERP